METISNKKTDQKSFEKIITVLEIESGLNQIIIKRPLVVSSNLCQISVKKEQN